MVLDFFGRIGLSKKHVCALYFVTFENQCICYVLLYSYFMNTW